MRIYHSVLFTLLLPFSLSLRAEDASSLFKAIHDRIYQIQTIELNSGSKSSLGSGFQIDTSGLLVTNFHVVASYALEPEKYRIEYVNREGQTGALELRELDVVNDLALVQHHDPNQHFLELADTPLEQGEAVFSMGNPHDLGMTVVSGTFNGLTAHSYYDRMLFSGSINPGMSGGPALNAAGKVIGVNVATAGNVEQHAVVLIIDGSAPTACERRHFTDDRGFSEFRLRPIRLQQGFNIIALIGHQLRLQSRAQFGYRQHRAAVAYQ